MNSSKPKRIKYLVSIIVFSSIVVMMFSHGVSALTWEENWPNGIPLQEVAQVCIPGSTVYTYTGNAIKPQYTVLCMRTLRENVDYYVTYKIMLILVFM